MKVDLRELSEEQITAIKEASKEAHFSSRELLEEIIPLIEPYFLAEYKICQKSLRFIFPNGQKFNLYIKEEK